MNGIRSISERLKVATYTALRWITRYLPDKLVVKLIKKHYEKLEVDELWSYIYTKSQSDLVVYRLYRRYKSGLSLCIKEE